MASPSKGISCVNPTCGALVDSVFVDDVSLPDVRCAVADRNGRRISDSSATLLTSSVYTLNNVMPRLSLKYSQNIEILKGINICEDAMMD